MFDFFGVVMALALELRLVYSLKLNEGKVGHSNFLIYSLYGEREDEHGSVFWEVSFIVWGLRIKTTDINVCVSFVL